MELQWICSNMICECGSQSQCHHLFILLQQRKSWTIKWLYVSCLFWLLKEFLLIRDKFNIRLDPHVFKFKNKNSISRISLYRFKYDINIWKVFKIVNKYICTAWICEIYFESFILVEVHLCCIWFCCDSFGPFQYLVSWNTSKIHDE